MPSKFNAVDGHTLRALNYSVHKNQMKSSSQNFRFLVYDFQSPLHQSMSRCEMKKTLAQQQSELLVRAESLFQASLVLDLIDDEGF